MRYLVSVCVFLICSLSLFAQAAPATPPAPAVAPKTPATPPPSAAAPAQVQAPEPAPVMRTLLEVKKVYLFPMRGGFDQMLANHLTSNKTFEIVTDSKLADAVITDNIGEAFQAKMREMYAPKPKPADKDPDDNAKDEPVKDSTYVPPISTFSRGRGTIFLVDTRTASVIWSVYMPPKNTSEAEVDRAARRVAEALTQPSKPVKSKKDLVGLFR